MSDELIADRDIPADERRAEHVRTAAMLNHVFDFEPPLGADDLAWYYDANPLGRAPVGRVEEGGRRLGNYALVPHVFGRGDGARLRLGLGVDLAVDPDARGSGAFRRTVEDAYRRGVAGGIDAILGVANANSAPRMVSALGWRALPDLPVRLLAPSAARGGFETHTVDDAFLASATFDRVTETGFAGPRGSGFEPVWTPELLRWRLAKRRARYWLHANDDVVAVSTRTTTAGVPFGVLCKVLARPARRTPVPGGALVRTVARTHRTPFVVHFGATRRVALRGLTLPRRFLPSPLALVLHRLHDDVDEAGFALDELEFLDFDAY